MLYLKEANLEDAEQEYLFVKDIPENENGFTNEWAFAKQEDFNKKALSMMIAYSKGEQLPDGFVPETYLFLWNDNFIVGQFRIRHYLCESLRNGAGHIGYYIQKEYRGKGFAKEGLRLTLDIARTIIPENEIYLRVMKDNVASLRVMLHNGGSIYKEDKKYNYVQIRNNSK